MKKSDLQEATDWLVKQQDLKSIIIDVVSKLLETFKQSMIEDLEAKLRRHYIIFSPTHSNYM